MADNYLEKRYEEVFGNGAVRKKTVSHSVSLTSLLLKNRSHRIYNQSYSLSNEELRELIDVCWKIPSVRNQQVLRYKLVNESSEVEKVIHNIRLGGHTQIEDIAPRSYIVVCSIVPETHYVAVDLGIAAQSILLRAVEMGLRGICIGAFNKEEITKELGLAYEPLLIIGIGKSSEKIQIVNIQDGDNQRYYERDGIHYVPKIKDLVL